MGDGTEVCTAVALCTVPVFSAVSPDKEQALKPLEEAAEVFGAWQGSGDDVLDEVADCIQACCNLAAALGCDDLRPYQERCTRRNRERGRY